MNALMRLRQGVGAITYDGGGGGDSWSSNESTGTVASTAISVGSTALQATLAVAEVIIVLGSAYLIVQELKSKRRKR